jgi:anti-sigma B factor antagonist
LKAIYLPLSLLESDPVSETGFPVTERRGQTVVATPDEIDLRNADSLRAALLAAAASNQPVTVVDMSGTEFCDSSGLNVLVRAQKQADADGRQLRLVVRAAALQRILAVSGTGRLFQIFDSLDQAVEAALPGRAVLPQGPTLDR